jgi:hypothetical protein
VGKNQGFHPLLTPPNTPPQGSDPTGLQQPWHLECPLSETPVQGVHAGWNAVEQRSVPGFEGTQAELDALLAEGLASKELTEDEFWRSVITQTDALLAEHKTGARS